jgi:hypothetical protein
MVPQPRRQPSKYSTLSPVVALSYEEITVLNRSNAGIISPNPTSDMDVCCIFCVGVGVAQPV